MKLYSGRRTIDGISVTVDGQPLPDFMAVHTYDDNGFEWSYVGTAPSQLAFALLMDHLGNEDMAKARVDNFVTSVIANLDNDWDLSGEDIEHALAELDTVNV